MQKRTLILSTLLAACILAVPCALRAAPPTTQADPAAPRHLAARLVDDARRRLRDGTLTPETAAAEASLLLQFAAALDPADIRALKMLSLAAHAAGKAPLEKETLRKLIAADKGDLVAQVQLLDLIADAAQSLEDRAKILHAAYSQEALDPQIRSEMAVRLSQIATERGDAVQEKQYLERAVVLNSVNVAALRGLARIAAQNTKAVPETLAALATVLTANPYQPDVWVELARICQRSNLHDRASDYLTVALEQFSLQGTQPPAELFLDLATEQAAAGRRAEAASLLREIAHLPDAPLSALLLAELLADATPATAPAAPAASQPEPLRPRIEKLLAELVKDNDPAALADAVTAELALLPTPSDNTVAWLDAYAKLVTPDDITLARLRGWQLYRAGKLDDARAALQKTAETDLLSQIGLARVLIAQNKKDDALKQLQDIWSSHPTGLLALQVTEAARLGSLTLADTQWTRQLRDVTTRIPGTLILAHRQPREIELIGLSLRRVTLPVGEPLLLSVRLTNATDRPLPTGPEGVAVTTIGLAAATRGINATTIGLYAVEDLQRTYRLEPHAVIDTSIRVDQGQLADVFERNPVASFLVSISAATAPRLSPTREFTAGLGGQLLQAGEFQRTGVRVSSPTDFEKLRQDLSSLTGSSQLIRIQIAGALLTSLYTETPGADVAAQQQAKQKLIDALLPLATSPDPLVRATLMRAIPPAPINNAPLDAAIATLAEDPDPVVRLFWVTRQAQLAALPADAGKAAATLLTTRAAKENDDRIKEWTILLTPHPRPATAPTNK